MNFQNLGQFTDDSHHEPELDEEQEGEAPSKDFKVELFGCPGELLKLAFDHFEVGCEQAEEEY